MNDIIKCFSGNIMLECRYQYKFDILSFVINIAHMMHIYILCFNSISTDVVTYV